MSSFGKVSPGQSWKPPRAEQQNSWDLSAEFYELKQRLKKRLPDQRMPVPTEMDVVKIRNDTGGDRLESQVVQLDIEIIDEPTRLHPWVSGIKPDSRCKRYAILRYATKASEIRWAQVSGPTFALVDITNGHKKCSPKQNQFNLVGDDDGPIAILWKPSGETEGVHECIVDMGQPYPPGAYVAKIPAGGIPALEGDYPGYAICEIWRLETHDYISPQPKSLVPVLKPDGLTLTKAIYNLSLSPIDEAVGYHPVHREECGNWFTSIGNSRLTLLSPVSCFRSWETSPQEMYLHEFQTCEWVKTSTIVLAVDPNDTNFLLPGETQWAQIKPGCMAGGKPIYELVGSRGLLRRAKANADIECGVMGSATIYDSVPAGTCGGPASWTFTQGVWVPSVTCSPGCSPETTPEFFPGSPGEGQVFTSPCTGEPAGGSCEDPQATECVVDVCNSWGSRQCIPDNAKIEVEYLKRGIWTPRVNRNNLYFANVTEALCPDNEGAVAVTNVQPLQFCETDEEKQSLTSAINKLSRATIAQEPVLLVRDTATCDGEVYVVAAAATCRDVPMTNDCGGDGIYLFKNVCVSIDSDVQRKVAVETCTEMPERVAQIVLVTVPRYRYTMTQSGCVVSLQQYQSSICALGDTSEGQPTSAGGLTFSTERFVKVDWTLDCGEEGNGSGEGTAPKLIIATGYALTLDDCTSDGDPVEIELLEESLVTNFDCGDEESCPSASSAVFAFLGLKCSSDIVEDCECEDYECPEEGGSGE